VDPIRPIGPAERDIEPVVRVTRSSAPDREGRRREPGERRDPPEPRRPLPPPASPASEDPDGPSLIDIKV
jgi:hypothetical protein